MPIYHVTNLVLIQLLPALPLAPKQKAPAPLKAILAVWLGNPTRHLFLGSEGVSTQREKL